VFQPGGLSRDDTIGNVGDDRGDAHLVGIGERQLGASLLCGIAQSQELLIAARFVQGVGGAMTSAVILGMIVTMFPEPREQAKAIGVRKCLGVCEC
jgi:MFS family permease